MLRIDYALQKQSITGAEDECGDAGLIQRTGEALFLALVDVLGHGPEAHAVSVSAEDFLRNRYCPDLAALMKGLHLHLKGTRGAVAALCRLDPVRGELCHVSVGNINVRIFGPRPYRFVSQDGIIGYMMNAPKAQTMTLHQGDVLVMASDGIRAHFAENEHPHLLKGPAEKIAAYFMNNLRKHDDDASCIALRYGK